MRFGQALAAKRAERGLTVEQVSASLRIKTDYLRALEANDLSRIPALVYAKGYLRAYATYLGLDASELMRQLPSDLRPKLEVNFPRGQRPRAVLTTPALAAAGLVLIAGVFAGYVWREMVSDQRAMLSPSPAQTASATLATTPAASPAVQARPIVVGVRVTDTVWINAIVDGNPQYGDSGRTLPAGSLVYFTGLDVKITSGKASATYISIDGRNEGTMGEGVATREFSSQTSP